MNSKNENPKIVKRNVRNTAQDEQRFRDFSEAASDWLFELDQELKITYVSDGHEVVFGMSPEAFTGKTLLQIYEKFRLPGEEAGWRAHVAIMKKHQSWKDFSHTVLRADDERRVISTSAKAVF